MSEVRFFYPKFHDDMDIRSLVLAISRNLEYLDRLDPEHRFIYGRHQFSCRQVREGQEAFLRLLLASPDLKKLKREIKKRFHVYRAAGRAGKRSVLFTGYYEPVFNASLVPDDRFRYPLYGQPDDLLKIDLSRFHEKYKGATIVARIEGRNVLPYYSREEIESQEALKGKGLEIAWLEDPVDVAFLHIQGSGRLSLPDGNMISVGYAASNGRRYHSIGRYMIDEGYLSRDEVSMQGIRKYLASHPEIVEDVLNYNPSYVFFRQRENGPFGNINVLLTPGRSIALDSRLFPKGALCFISTEKPIIDSDGRITAWTKFSRFVVNQDTGGAIKGAGRADIYYGSGEIAGIAAGHMKHEGDLYVLIKKP